MTVNTKTVQGRRRLRFESLDELIAEVRFLTTASCKTLGNWSPGQIFEHLRKWVDVGYEPTSFIAPWYIRYLLVPVMKNAFLTQTMSAGFQPSKRAAMFEPAATVDQQTAGAQLLAALERLKHEPPPLAHPIFGHMAQQEWWSLTARHSELHLSFLLPEGHA